MQQTIAPMVTRPSKKTENDQDVIPYRHALILYH